MSAASHSDNAASSLPAARPRRDTGARSRLSSVPRSRSPLTASPATSIARSAPTATATCTVRLTVSRRSRKLSAWFVAPRYVMTLTSRLSAKASGRPRPASHRSRSSRPATTPQSRAAPRGRETEPDAMSVLRGHGQERVAEPRALELEREQRDPGLAERLHDGVDANARRGRSGVLGERHRDPVGAPLRRRRIGHAAGCREYPQRVAAHIGGGPQTPPPRGPPPARDAGAGGGRPPP